MKTVIDITVAGTLRERINSIDSERIISELKINGTLNQADKLCIRQLTGTHGRIKVLDITNTSGYERIDRNDFEEGSILSILRLPLNLKTLGWGAFCMCDKLTTITMPNGIESIDNYAFNGCIALKSVSLPKNLKTLGENAFGGCVGLEEFKINLSNKNYTAFNGVLYSKDGHTLVKYPAGKTDMTFAVPDDVITIANNAFFMNGNIHELTLPNGLQTIRDNAFCSCTALQNINIPLNVKKIGKGVFRCCDSLQTITCAATTPPEIEIAEDDNLNVNIYVPLTSADCYRQSDEWKELKNIYGK